MFVSVKVKAGAKKDRVEQLGANSFFVYTKAPPHDGKANASVAKLIAETLGIPRSCIVLRRGAKAKEKLFEVVP
ncbi:MAG: DUF167 domain-containing protein [bacterium]|nr:DUF167 domain-containing protein [bacterium]